MKLNFDIFDLLLCSQITLVVLKLCSVLTCSWWIVAIPTLCIASVLTVAIAAVAFVALVVAVALVIMAIFSHLMFHNG